MTEDLTKDNNRYISEFKFTDEELNLMKELFNKVDEVSEICQQLKSLSSKNEEINLTCKMWTTMTKQFLELMGESVFLDKADTKIIN